MATKLTSEGRVTLTLAEVAARKAEADAWLAEQGKGPSKEEAKRKLKSDPSVRALTKRIAALEGKPVAQVQAEMAESFYENGDS